MDLPEIALFIHVIIAILTVTSGTCSILFKKAGFLHKEAGKVYLYSMNLTVVSAFVLLTFPEYANPIMVFIGIFMLYLVITGYRSLKFKTVFSSEKVPSFDKTVSSLMGIASLAMFLFGIYTLNTGDMWGLPLIVYSVLGGINVSQDFAMFKSVNSEDFTWMKFHASKMIGSYIGAITAVLVTQFGDVLGIYAWFLTMFFGLIYMTYWVRKIKLNPASVFDW